MKSRSDIPNLHVMLRSIQSTLRSAFPRTLFLSGLMPLLFAAWHSFSTIVVVPPDGPLGEVYFSTLFADFEGGLLRIDNVMTRRSEILEPSTYVLLLTGFAGIAQSRNYPKALPPREQT